MPAVLWFLKNACERKLFYIVSENIHNKRFLCQQNTLELNIARAGYENSTEKMLFKIHSKYLTYKHKYYLYS